MMNAYASDCLGKYRISTDPVEFIEKAAPDQLDNIKLNTLGYQIDGDKNKCSHIVPSNEDEKVYMLLILECPVRANPKNRDTL